MRKSFVAAIAGVLLASSFEAQTITTIAGNGTAGYTGDGGAGTGARLNFPVKVASDSAGNIYFADNGNNAVRRVDATTGIISTIAGNGSAGYTGDGGLATSATLYSPWGVAVDRHGNIFIADAGNSVVRRIDKGTGIITTIAGNGTYGFSGDGGPALAASFNGITGIAVDAAGNIYLTDDNNNRIRKIDGATTIVSTIAGTGSSGFSGDGGLAVNATLNFPVGIFVDGNGVYLADSDNSRIRKIDSSGVITTVAGNGSVGYNGDGIPATSASLYNPWDVTTDAAGNIYIADFFNCRVRKVDINTGLISTYAGGVCGYSGDGGLATAAALSAPTGVCVTQSGNLIIADTYNNVVRKVGLPTQTVQGGQSCAQAINLDNLTCGPIAFTAPISQRWFKFTASASEEYLAIQPYPSSSPSAELNTVEVFSGNCHHLASLLTIEFGPDSGVAVKKLTGLISGNTYYVKLDFVINTGNSATIIICIQPTPPPAPLSTPYSPPVCASGCTLVNENFNYTNNIPLPHGGVNPAWGSPFYYGYAPCWGDAANTPQIPNDYAYMWTEYYKSTGPLPHCGPGGRQSEAIFTPLPLMSPNKLYVLRYDYFTDPGHTCDEVHAIITPVSACINWPITGNVNSLIAQPQLNLDPTNTNVTNTTPLTRQICLQIPNTPGYLGPNNLAFYPLVSLNNPCVRQILDIDNVQLYEIDPTIAASYVGGGCHGECTQLSLCNLPSGMVTYQWAPATGLSCTNCPNPIACPTTTTTYTVTITVVGSNANYNTTCPQVQGTITVNPLCQGPALATGMVGSTNVAGNNTLTNNIVIASGATYNINNASVGIKPNVSIRVLNNATLNITNSNLFACSDMWQGIIVDPRGTVNVNGNSLIEDAVVAIDNGLTTPFVGSPPVINVNGAVFNCNRTGIRQAFYQSPLPANYSTANFNVNDAVFTCRCGMGFPISTNQLTLYKNFVNGNGNTLAPDLSDYYNLFNYQAANLKVPYLNAPALEGIHLENNGVPAPQNSVPIPYIHTIGGANLVLFDNHVYGINALNATFHTTNSAFQVPRQLPQGIFGTLQIGGYGINAINNNKDLYNGIYVDNSRFIDMVRGVHNVNYFDIDISNNTLFSRQLITPAGLAFVTPPKGGYGIFTKTVRFLNAKMNSNNLANINNGIDFVIDASPGNYNSGNGEFVADVQINSNTMADQFPGNAYSNRYIGNGIIADNVIAVPNSTPPANVAPYNTRIFIKGNTITKAFRGILARNHQYQKVRDSSNLITLQYEPTMFSTQSTQYGIEHANVIYQQNVNNFGDDIYSNSITGFTTPADYGNLPYFEPKKGIWCVNTGNHYVTCNVINKAGRAIEFDGNNTPCFWRLNQMSNSGQGYILDNSGVIGHQGSSSNGQDNTWVGFSALNPETIVNNGSFSASSNLFVFSGLSGGTPINNQGNSSPYISFPPAAGPSSTAGPDAYDCSVSPPLIVENPHQGNLVTRDGNTYGYTSGTTSDIVALMEKIVQDSIPYSSFIVENSFINKNMIYRQIRQDTSLLINSSILRNFYSASSTSNFALFCVIEDSLAVQNYAYASGLIASIFITNGVELNYKTFYKVYLHAMQGIFSQVDSLNLEQLASCCPMINGAVVFQARAFHNSFYNEFVHYEDHCPQASTYSNRGLSSTALKSGKPKITVYPNPSSGSIHIVVNDKATHNYVVEIHDLSGRYLLKQNLTLEDGLGALKIDVERGVYLLYLYDTESLKAEVCKIIIGE